MGKNPNACRVVGVSHLTAVRALVWQPLLNTVNFPVAGVRPRCYGESVPKDVLMCWRGGPTWSRIAHAVLA